jgi:hypothetical protein
VFTNIGAFQPPIHSLVTIPVRAMEFPGAALTAHSTAANQFLFVADLPELFLSEGEAFRGRGSLSSNEFLLNKLSKPIVEALEVCQRHCLELVL